ncbi:VPA1262 family N-terminal domain-containing protein [Edwardsiella tarda]|uniref:VPA1262 family N-terminal domain-containing protein n=1 Tax=Edwardsiella tarda TaxID=636 RepID=UPI003F65C5BB
MTDRINEVELLLKSGVLGFYNAIEITEVFSLNSDSKPCNILTIMVAEDFKNPIYNTENYLTTRLISVKKLKKWRFGVKRYCITIPELMAKLSSLDTNMRWDQKQVEINNLQPLDKYFISPDSYESVPLNSILKNNYYNGSYVFEWFDLKKENHQDLLSSPLALQDLSEELRKVIPISIDTVSDRVGNFLLQIPTRILMSNFGLEKKCNGYNLNCEIDWHHNAKKRDLIINCHLREIDSLCEGYFTKILKSGDLTLSLPIANKRSHIGTIWDPENNLILARTRPSAFISSTAKIITTTSIISERLLTADSQSKKVGILISDKNRSSHSKKPILNWIEKRIYDNSSTALKKSRNFVQYNPKGVNKPESKMNALDDLIYLINTHGHDAVWLWDPYLSFQDLFDTLLQNKHSSSMMKAISSLKSPHSSQNRAATSISQSTDSLTIDKYKDCFKQLPPETLKTINLEFRCKTGSNGWDFHDRFIIFPASDYDSTTLAWSLGTSVNSYGTSHHILQKVQDAQLIANAFLNLWNNLENSECLVWRNINE